jgi:hypothetical protein
MIVVKLMGGHSNQLFQYAVGRNLAEKHKTELLLDISWFNDTKDVAAPRDYELACYSLKASTTDMNNIKIVDGAGRLNHLLHKSGFGRSVKTYNENGLGYDPQVMRLPNNSMLVGYWQNERYFKHLRLDILKEIEPVTPLSKSNQKLITKIQSCESVWMHVRRGDYVEDKNTNAFHGLKGADYYKKALKTLISKLPEQKAKNIEIFVCSNDIAWCKQNLKFKYPVHFVENKLGSDDMRVVKHCKHDIIANSSFSWWGAWLNQNPDKIVIAPKVWFEDKKANSDIEIVPKEWIQL